VATTDACLRVSGTVRRTFRHAFISAAINAFFRSECFFLRGCFRNRTFLRHRRHRAVQSAEPIEANTEAIRAKSVVGALIRAQFNLAGISGKAGSALAFSSWFMTNAILVTVIWARALVACYASPGLSARLAGLAVTGTGHRVAGTMARAILRALFVTTV